MIEELRHELVRLTYSPEIVSFELTREQGLEILEEIKRLNKENEHLRTALNSKESIIKEVREFVEWHYKDNQEFYKNKGIGLNYPECDAVLEILDKEKEQ